MVQFAVPEDRLEEFGDFFENAPVGVVVLDHEGVVRYANRVQRRLTRCGDSDLVGLSLADLLADDAAAASIIAAGNRGEAVHNLRVARSGPDGPTGIVVNAAPGREPRDPGPEIYCVMFDADSSSTAAPPQQRQEEGALHDSSPAVLEMLVRAFDNAPVGLHIVGADGLVRWANRMELETLGYQDDPEAYLGHHIAEFHADQAVIDDMLDRLVGGRPLVQHRATLLTRAGEHLPVVIYSSPRFDGEDFLNTRCYTLGAAGLEPEPASFSWPRNADDDQPSNAGELTTVLQRLAGRREAEESLGLLAESGRVLAGPEGLSGFCRLVVPYVADACQVVRAGADGSSAVLATEGPTGRGTAIERAPFASGAVTGELVLERSGARPAFGAADRALAAELAARVAIAIELDELRAGR